MEVFRALGVLVHLGTATIAGGAERPLIFPEPQKITVHQDGFLVDEQVPVVVPESASAGDVALARQLIAELSDRYGVPLRTGPARCCRAGGSS
ncbi:MAG TPA: hypothetical protein VEU11_14555 [Terriglobales bacterium]|nr:hypothetical protein [Terriglobales bacterium]